MLVNKVWFFPALVNGRNLHQIWSEHPECNTTVLKYPKSIVEDHGRMHACYTHVDPCKLLYNNMYSLIFHHFKAIRWCSVERSHLMKCFLFFLLCPFVLFQPLVSEVGNVRKWNYGRKPSFCSRIVFLIFTLFLWNFTLSYSPTH